MRWNLQQLKDDVDLVHGKEQRNILSPCIQSIIDRKLYARYHFQEFERLLTEFLKGNEDQVSLSKLVLGSDEEERIEFNHCRKMVEANIVACLQSLHAISDILSHVIYFSLNMDSKVDLKLSPRYVSLHNVENKISIKSEYSKLSSLIEQLISHQDYRYLVDIVNHSKHRSVVGTSFTVDGSGESERHYGLEFVSFSYEGRNHPKKWIDDYLSNEYARQDPLTLEIGNEVNALVKEILTSKSASML